MTDQTGSAQFRGCPDGAVLVLEGEHYQCRTMDDMAPECQSHEGWAHSNGNAGALWTCNASGQDSALALVSRQVSAAIEASHREIDAPLWPRNNARVAWADGYTQACDDIRAAIRKVASDGT